MAELRGNLTSLRPLRDDDAPYIFRWLNNPQVMQYWGGLSETLTEEESHEWIRDHSGGEPGVEAFVIQEKGTPVGFIELSGQPDDANYRHMVELDICIGEPDRWNTGLGTDALKALMRHLFTERGILRIFLQPRVSNARAVRVYEKCGFVKEGVLRDAEMIDGHLQDCVMMAALRDEWLARFGTPR